MLLTVSGKSQISYNPTDQKNSTINMNFIRIHGHSSLWHKLSKMTSLWTNQLLVVFIKIFRFFFLLNNARLVVKRIESSESKFGSCFKSFFQFVHFVLKNLKIEKTFTKQRRRRHNVDKIKINERGRRRNEFSIFFQSFSFQIFFETFPLADEIVSHSRNMRWHGEEQKLWNLKTTWKLVSRRQLSYLENV